MVVWRKKRYSVLEKKRKHTQQTTKIKNVFFFTQEGESHTTRRKPHERAFRTHLKEQKIKSVSTPKRHPVVQRSEA